MDLPRQCAGSIYIYDKKTGLPSSVCVVCYASVMAVSFFFFFIKLASLKAKFKALKTDENEIKALKITSMLFNFVFLCLFWQFKARESGIFKITIRLAQK